MLSVSHATVQRYANPGFEGIGAVSACRSQNPYNAVTIMENKSNWEKITLPPELLSSLNAMIRRVRRLQIARGALATFGVFLASVLVVMGIDAAIPIYSDSVRVAISMGALALTIITAYVSLWRPLADPLTPFRMARIVETRHPELQERISSAMELLGGGDDAAAEGSRELLAILAEAAGADVAAISARSEFRGDTLRPVIAVAAISAAILVLLFISVPRQTALLFSRAVAPRAHLDNLAARGFEVTPGDIAIVEGESIRFTLRAQRSIGDKAELCIERPGEPLSVERMARAYSPEGEFYELAIPSVRRSFRYRMRLGSALTRYHQVEVVPQPALGDLAISLEYPEYTSLASTQFVSAAEVPLSIPVGTHATIAARLNRQLSASLRLAGATLRPAEPQPSSTATFDWLATPLRETATWSLNLADSRGFTNFPSPARYEVITDIAPHVVLTYPTENSYTLPSFAFLKLSFDIDDDYGIASASLRIHPDNDRTPWPLDLEVPATNTSFSLSHDLILSDFQLGGAKKLRIWLEVTDNMPASLGGPNISKSRVVAVNLDNSQKLSLADQVRVPERDTITNMLQAASQRIDEAMQAIASLTNGHSSAVATASALDTAFDEAKAAAEAAKEAAETAEKGLFATLGDDIREAADEKADKAMDAIDAIATAVDDDDMHRLANEAMGALEAVKEQFDDLVPEVLAKDKVLKEVSELEAAAAQEASLARQAAERQFTKDEMEKWQKTQENLADKIEGYDLRNAPLENEEMTHSSENLSSPTPQPQTSNQEQGTPNKEQGTPIKEQGTRNEEQGTSQPPNNQTTKPNKAAEAARAAAEAAARAAETPVDENKLKVARQAEAAAKASQRAAEEARKAALAKEKLEKTKSAMEAVRDAAQAAKQKAEGIADDALQVNLEAVRQVAAEVPPEVKKALELAKKAEALAAEAEAALRAAEEGGKPRLDAIEAAAKSLRDEAEKSKQSSNPFAREAAVPGRGKRRAHASRTAADDQHVDFRHDRYLTRLLLIGLHCSSPSKNKNILPHSPANFKHKGPCDETFQALYASMEVRRPAAQHGGDVRRDMGISGGGYAACIGFSRRNTGASL